MLYTIIFFIIAIASFLFAMLGLGGGMVGAVMAVTAAATTAFVVTFSSFSGYFGHMVQGEMNWTLTIIVVAAVVIGSQLGGRFMTQKAKSKQVKIIYAVVLLLIAAKLIFDALA